MHVKYEVFISCGSKVIAKVEVDNRQTNRQTGQNNMPRSFDSGYKKEELWLSSVTKAPVPSENEGQETTQRRQQSEKRSYF